MKSLSGFVLALALAAGAAGQTPQTTTPAASEAPPRPLEDVDRYAAQLAADYLARGPEAFWDELSNGSPLRDLTREEALAEIEARAGSPVGARWELRTPSRSLGSGRAIFAIQPPSGLDQAIVLNVASEGGRLRLYSIRSLSEPLRREEPVEPAPAAEPAIPRRRLVLSSALFGAAVVLLAVAAAVRRASSLACAVVGALGLASGGGAVVALRGGSATNEAQAPVVQRVERMTRLGSLVPFRTSLEKGEAASLPVSLGPVAAVGQVWQVQMALQRGDRAEARKLLSSLPDASELPWADLLRGRLGFLEKSEQASVRAYENVIDFGVFHDGLLVEAIEAFSILGYLTPRDWGVEKLAALGSRSAEAHYVLAMLLYRARRWDDSERTFASAWRLRPLDRRSIFLVGGQMWGVLRRPSVFASLRLGEPGDVVAPPPQGLSARPMKLPEGARAFVCGADLEVSLPGGAELTVDAGAELAPAGLVPEDAGAPLRREEERSLADLEGLSGRLSNVGALSQPALRGQLEKVSIALGRRHRWRELSKLTTGFGGSAEQVPAIVLILRAESLRRTHRADMAKALLAELEAGPVPERLGDAVLYYEMGELYAAMEDLDGAIRCIEKAFALRREPVLHERLRRLRSERQLLSGFDSVSVGRFEVRFPETWRDDLPQRVGKVLNAEWKRLEPSIPSVKGRPVVVELLDFEDFQETFGWGILGLFDGKIRLPLLGVPELTPPIVALITHELTHAMLADATDDRAPGWLQEGLAQKLEMQLEVRENKVPDLERMGTLLSLASVEETLRTFPDFELVKAAYHQSEWLVRYVEKKHGPKALARLFTEFESGRTVDEACRAALGLSEREVDLRFREWALGEAPRDVKDAAVVWYEK